MDAWYCSAELGNLITGLEVAQARKPEETWEQTLERVYWDHRDRDVLLMNAWEALNGRFGITEEEIRNYKPWRPGANI